MKPSRAVVSKPSVNGQGHARRVSFKYSSDVKRHARCASSKYSPELYRGGIWMKSSDFEAISEGTGEGPAPRTVREFQVFLGDRDIWMKSSQIRSDPRGVAPQTM